MSHQAGGVERHGSRKRQGTEERKKTMNPNPTYLPRRITNVAANPIEEASPQNPYLIPKPLLRKSEFEYDIPGGCQVRLVLRNENVYHGTMFINPKNDITDKTMLKLIKVAKVSPTTFEPIAAKIGGILEFHTSEIQKAYVLSYVKPMCRRMGEMIMDTFVVRTMPQFKNLMAALTSGDSSEVAFKLFGLNKGRFMKLYWIVFCTRQTLIPMYMQGELDTQFVWMELKEKLFENSKILKIVHDVRFEADFLFHAVLNGIRMKNVFDTQLAVYFMDIRKRMVWKRKFMKENPGARIAVETELFLSKLSLSLARYLGNVVWEKELNLIFKFETDDWCSVTYFSEEPLPPPDALKYMALCVKYLGLLKNELMSDMMTCYDLCCKKMMRHMYLTNVAGAVSSLEESIRFPKELYEDLKNFSTTLNLESTREIETDNRSFLTKSSDSERPSQGVSRDGDTAMVVS